MMAFPWIDGDGVQRILDTPAPIEAEYTRCRQQLLDLAPQLKDGDDAVYLRIRPTAVRLRDCIAQLAQDLGRWNAEWEQEIRRLAIEASTEIGGFMAEARYLSALHRCYDQHAEQMRCTPDPSLPPSVEQMQVLTEQARRSNSHFSPPETFDEAHSCLISKPATNRILLATPAKTFEWRDLDGYRHQLRSVTPIEEAYIRVVDKMVKLLTDIAQDDVRKCAIGLEKIQLCKADITIIQHTGTEWTQFILKQDRDEFASTLRILEHNDGHAE
ncbi:MAG: hypothetical protein QHC67_10220 [Sphingobium sp.]|uniref:hypothetical protein n=1 Tax=Sphingobium sp. TaxID=1912891 RepID=UPI0029BCFBA3|nr:hypothetical protein [Sphingobium sp.]MDX3910180.1 hypothetical protein [Sphingobium sp.]